MILKNIYIRLSLVSQTTKIHNLSDFTACNTRRVIITITTITIIITPLSYLSRRLVTKKLPNIQV